MNFTADVFLEMCCGCAPIKLVKMGNKDDYRVVCELGVLAQFRFIKSHKKKLQYSQRFLKDTKSKMIIKMAYIYVFNKYIHS